jgi:hypothetical protein
MSLSNEMLLSILSLPVHDEAVTKPLMRKAADLLSERMTVVEKSAQPEKPIEPFAFPLFTRFDDDKGRTWILYKKSMSVLDYSNPIKERKCFKFKLGGIAEDALTMTSQQINEMRTAGVVFTYEGVVL